MDDVQQAAEFIFKTYPQVTMVKYIGPAGMDIISRDSANKANKLLRQIEQNKNSEEQSNKKC